MPINLIMTEFKRFLRIITMDIPFYCFYVECITVAALIHIMDYT